MHYLDYAATSPVLPEAREAMNRFHSDAWANPSSVYAPAREARRGIEEAREELARAVNCAPEEIVFTSGGTEAANLAVKGTAFARGRGHVLVSAIEHHAVLDSARWLVSLGFSVEELAVDRYGLVEADQVAAKLRDDTILVAVMLANNEIGTVQPVAEIASVCRERKVAVLTDAVQALGKIPVDVRGLGVDLAAFSAHKIGGPKGTGALYVRRGVRLEPVLHGGGQERGRRSGTENVAGAAGFGAAARVVTSELDREPARWLALRERMAAGIQSRIPGVTRNGHPERRLPHNLHLSIPGVLGEDVLLMLDAAGVCASVGSACQSGSVEASYVLAACGLEKRAAMGALRLTVGRGTTDADVDALIEVLPPIVERLRGFAGART